MQEALGMIECRGLVAMIEASASSALSSEKFHSPRRQNSNAGSVATKLIAYDDPG
jgi:hypothetical protein